jgi:NDP-sugar pyrophosphorylase family protein
MRSLILSAGYGTRLLPLTDVIPKPMFPVMDSSIISIIIDNINLLGINEIGVNLHHLADKLGAHLLRIRKPGGFFYTPLEKELLGTGGAIKSFRDFIEDDLILVHNCDVLSDVPLYDLIDEHNLYSPLATIFLTHNALYNSVSFDKNGVIVDIAGKLGVHNEESLTFSGIYVLSPEIYQYFSEKESFSIIDVLLKAITEKPGSVRAWLGNSDVYWRDIGSIGSYLELHRDLLCNNSLLILPSGYPKEHSIQVRMFQFMLHPNYQASIQ